MCVGIQIRLLIFESDLRELLLLFQYAHNLWVGGESRLTAKILLDPPKLRTTSL